MLPSLPRIPLTAAAKARWNLAPCSGSVVSGDGVWDLSTASPHAYWTLDEAGLARSTTWNASEGASTVAVFGSASVFPADRSTPVTVTLPAAYASVGGVEFRASPVPHRLQQSGGSGGLTLPASATVSADAGATGVLACDLRAAAGSLSLTKAGAGVVRLEGGSGTLAQLATVAVNAGTLEASATGRDGVRAATALSVASGAVLRFSSSQNVDITGALTGAGTIEVTGGGHLLYHGRDVNQRPIQSVSGWTGSFSSPAVNHAPVITSDFSAKRWVSRGVLNTFAITATDADGDALSLSLTNGTQGGQVAVSGMNLNFTPTSNTEYTINFQVSDGYGGQADGVIHAIAHDPYDLYIQGEYTSTPVPVGPTTLTVGSGTTYRIGLDTTNASENTNRPFQSAVSGSGTIQVVAEKDKPSSPSGGYYPGRGALRIVGTGSTFTGSYQMEEGMNFYCGSNNWVGGFDGTPLRVPTGSNYSANPGPCTIRTIYGGVSFAGLASSASTISANMLNTSEIGGISFSAGTYTCTGTDIQAPVLSVFNARVTFTNTTPRIGQAGGKATIGINWYRADSTVSPRITLPNNPNFGTAEYSDQWYYNLSGGIRPVMYVSFFDFTDVATLSSIPAGTYVLVLWTGTMYRELAPYDSQYFAFPNRYTVTTTNSIKTWEWAGWGKFVFDPNGSYTLIKS